MDKEIGVYVEDILESIEKIEQYIQGVNPSRFEQDSSIQDAVIRRLEIIGEAVKRLPESVKIKQPNIPWKDIAGMRDVLIHEYAGVHLKRVWQTVINDLPVLKRAVGQMRN